jgi:hypothetical protein|tara:strand:+ start:243 stop:446 length:204 start_codon:yes stop_codon:yes gene_type:complete
MQQMRAEKSDFRTYTSSSIIGTISRPTNVVDLIKKNKMEKTKEKMLKIYTLFGFVGLFLLFVIFIYP